MLDPLLLDDPADWPTEWAPFTVWIRPSVHTLELAASGVPDSWTSGALLRDVEQAYDPSHTEIRLDPSAVTACDRAAVVALAHCREFAARVGAHLRVTPPSPSRPNGSLAPAEGPARSAAVAARGL